MILFNGNVHIKAAAVAFFSFGTYANKKFLSACISASTEERIRLSIPVIFIHRADEGHLGLCMQQAMASNPKSRVILIGTRENRKHIPDGAEHHLIDDYSQSAKGFASFYRHLSPNNFAYNLFCFQRWFILRDFMKVNELQKILYLDSDVLLYCDISKPDYERLALEFSWTTVCNLPTLDRYCAYLTAHFRETSLLHKLLDYCRSIGNAPLSDMVTCIHFRNYYLRIASTYGVFGDSFFDHNLSCPLAPPCDQIELLEGKKKIYWKYGALHGKLTEKDGFLKVNSLHFQGATKHYIPFFLPSNLPSHDALHYFNYATCQWLLANSKD